MHRNKYRPVRGHMCERQLTVFANVPMAVAQRGENDDIRRYYISVHPRFQWFSKWGPGTSSMGLLRGFQGMTQNIILGLETKGTLTGL